MRCEKVQMNARISKSDYNKLRELAEESDVSLSVFLRVFIRQLIEGKMKVKIIPN